MSLRLDTENMLKHLIAKIDMCDTISLTKEINVLDAIHCVDRNKRNSNRRLLSCQLMIDMLCLLRNAYDQATDARQLELFVVGFFFCQM